MWYTGGSMIFLQNRQSEYTTVSRDVCLFSATEHNKQLKY